MRTTLTLDPDVEKLLREEAHRQRRPFKAVVNDALRRGLTTGGNDEPRGQFRVTPHRTALQPGVKVGSLNRLTDEMEDQAVVERLREGR